MDNPKVVLGGLMGLTAAGMQLRFQDFDHLCGIEIPPGQGGPDGLEDREHAPVRPKRGHMRVQAPALELRKAVEFINQKMRDAHVFTFIVPVEPRKYYIFAEG